MKSSVAIRLSAVSVLLGALWAQPAKAAQVAPNVVFINAGERGAELMVRNGGQEPIEVQVGLSFGYEATDHRGQVQSVYTDDPDHPKSAASWLRAYPQRTVIAPGSRQSIRLFSRAPADVEPGEYWARIEVQSRPTRVPTRAAGDDDEIQVRVGVTTRQRIPIFVRVGETEASFAVGAVRARVDEKSGEDGEVSRSVYVRYRARLAGNAAFLGTMHARIENGGKVLAERRAPLAVFVPGVRGARLALSDDVSAADLRGATLILEARREHPAIAAADLVSGRALRWEGPLALE